jgi:hypothetical protein
MAASPTFRKGATMKKVLCWMMVFVAAGMAGFLSCGPSSGNYVTNPSGGNPTSTMTGTYRISGDSIYVTPSNPIDTVYSYCFGDSLVLYIDTIKESGMPYSISNNTLIFTNTDPSMNGTGYTMAIVMTYSRQGTGVGVEGTWNAVSVVYTVQSGTAPDSIRQEIDSMNAMFNRILASGDATAQYIFSNGQFTSNSSYSYNWTDNFVSSWTKCSLYGTDTCSYAVTVVKLSSSSVKLVGKTSGETVTITWNSKGDETFTSSDPAHTAHTYYANPKQCPNDYQPTWFITFLTANAKPGAVLYKKSAQQIVPKKTPQLKWLKVF